MSRDACFRALKGRLSLFCCEFLWGSVSKWGAESRGGEKTTFFFFASRASGWFQKVAHQALAASWVFRCLYPSKNAKRLISKSDCACFYQKCPSVRLLKWSKNTKKDPDKESIVHFEGSGGVSNTLSHLNLSVTELEMIMFDKYLLFLYIVTAGLMNEILFYNVFFSRFREIYFSESLRVEWPALPIACVSVVNPGLIPWLRSSTLLLHT